MQQTGCTSTECAVQVGKVLGVRRLVSGKITRLDGEHWLVSAQLIDVETAQTLRATSVQYTGSFFDFLRDGPPVLAARIAGTEVPQKPGLASRLIELVNPFSGANPPAAGPSAPPAPPAAGEPPPNAPKRGFALFGGFVDTSGILHSKSAGSLKFSGGGFGNIGAEFQWIPSAPLSLTGYIVGGSGGSLSGDLTPFYDELDTMEYGVELRYWLGRSYFGGHLASFNVALYDNSGRGNSAFNMNGIAYGVSGGYEWDDGWFVRGALDYASGNSQQVTIRTEPTAARVPLTGSFESSTVWALGGYHWK